MFETLAEKLDLQEERARVSETSDEDPRTHARSDCPWGLTD